MQEQVAEAVFQYSSMDLFKINECYNARLQVQISHHWLKFSLSKTFVPVYSLNNPEMREMLQAISGRIWIEHAHENERILLKAYEYILTMTF